MKILNLHEHVCLVICFLVICFLVICFSNNRAKPQQAGWWHGRHGRHGYEGIAIATATHFVQHCDASIREHASYGTCVHGVVLHTAHAYAA